MAKVKLHPIIGTIQGRLGSHVFRRTPTGGTSIIQRADMSNVQWSEAQQAHRERFREAVAFAKAAMADPQVRGCYEAEAVRLNKRAYDLAVSDYFKNNRRMTQEDYCI